MRSLIDRVLAGIGSLRSTTVTGLSLRDPELARKLGWGGGPTSAGVPVDEFSAMTYAAVWAAVSLISSQVASLPLILYKRTSNGGKESKERFTSHQTYRLLHDEPNPEMSSMVMRETLMAHCLTWGNGYAEIERDQLGRPIALWPLLPNQVQPYRDNSLRLRYLVRTPGAPDIEIPAADMLHVPGLGFDGLKGYSVVHMARESLGLGLAAQKFGATFFGNGSTFGGVLTHPKTLVDPALKNLKESVDSRHAGVERAHRFLILEEGMTYQKLGIDPNSAQFLETRQFEISEVARWFNIPPHKLRDLMRATFSNIEQQAIEFVVDTLTPWLVRWEQELNRKLISRSERNIQFVEHLVEGLLRGDSMARSEFYSKMFGIGALSINEIRSRENLNPIGTEGDVYWVPMNMKPATIQMLPDPQPAPAAPAPKDGSEPDPNAARYETLVIEMRETRTGWERVTAAVTARDAELSVVGSRLDAIQAERAFLMAQLDTAQGAVKLALEAELATRDRAAAELAEAKASMQASLDRWAADEANLRSQLEAQQAELESVRQAKESIEADRQTLRAAVETSTVTIAELEAARDAQRARADAAVASHQLLEAERRAQEAALQEEADARLHAVTSDLEAARAERDQVDEERRTIQAALLEQREMSASQVATWAHGHAAAAGKLALAEARVDELTTTQAGLIAERESAAVAEETRRVAANQAFADLRVELEARAAEAERMLHEEMHRAVESVSAEASERDAHQAAERAAAVAEAEARAADLRAQLEAASAALVAQRAEAAAEAARLQAIVDTSERERQSVVVDMQEAVRQAAAAAVARTEAEARAEAAQRAEETRVAGIVSAHRGLVVDTMRRMIEREADRARRAQATPEKLRTWMESFYTAHEDLCAHALLPVVRVHLAWMGSGDESAAVTRELARRHVERSLADLRSVLSEDPDEFTLALNRVLHHWEHERSQELADHLLQKEIGYGRGREAIA